MGSKTFAIVTILCIMFGASLIYAVAYNIRGEELIFTAEGAFERVVVKIPSSMRDLGYIYENGGSFSYLTGRAPSLTIFQIIVYTSDNNYFDFMHSVLIGSETAEIGGVQITMESRYENIGVINPLEWIIIVFGGLLLGIVILSAVVFALESKGIYL